MSGKSEDLRTLDEILDEMPLELFFALVRGIFVRARVDYLYDSDGARRDAEVFFRSSWAQKLSLSAFDPDQVIKQMNEEIENGLGKSHGNPLEREW